MARLVPLTVCYSIPEAHVLALALRAEGVYAAIAGIHHGTLAWTHLVALGGLEVRVLDVQLSDARKVLASAVPHSEILTESETFRRHPWIYSGLLIFFMYLGAWYPLWIKHRRWKS
jgi:hypothetical protein